MKWLGVLFSGTLRWVAWPYSHRSAISCCPNHLLGILCSDVGQQPSKDFFAFADYPQILSLFRGSGDQELHLPLWKQTHSFSFPSKQRVGLVSTSHFVYQRLERYNLLATLRLLEKCTVFPVQHIHKLWSSIASRKRHLPLFLNLRRYELGQTCAFHRSKLEHCPA